MTIQSPPPAGTDLQTACGPLSRIDLSDSATQSKVLLADKLQVTEGLVVEYFVDRILGRIGGRNADGTVCRADSAEALQVLAADTIIASSSDSKKDPFAFVLMTDDTSNPPEDYMRCLQKKFQVIPVRWDAGGQCFRTGRMQDGRAVEIDTPLMEHLQALSGLTNPLEYDPVPEGRGGQRHLRAVRFLQRRWGADLVKRVIIPRIFVNCAVQSWFEFVWNVDRVLLTDGGFCALEIKHKYPRGGKTGPFSYGINNGQLEVLCRLSDCGIRCVHLILANPHWSRDTGCGYLMTEEAARSYTGVHVKDMTAEVLSQILCGESRPAPPYTRLCRGNPLGVRYIAVRAFSDLGVLSAMSQSLRAQLVRYLEHEELPALTDELLINRRLSFRGRPEVH